MKKRSVETFYTDLNHPRAKYRDFENDSGVFDPDIDIQVPILLFHKLNNSLSRITFNNESSLRKISCLKEVYGINCILTSLSHQKNYFENLKNAVENISIRIFEFNLFYNKLEDLKLDWKLREKLIYEIEKLYYILMTENITLLVHSACGNMKNGLIVYSILRMNQETKESALEIITKLKNERKVSIGDFNIEFIENYIVPELMNRVKFKSFSE